MNTDNKNRSKENITYLHFYSSHAEYKYSCSWWLWLNQKCSASFRGDVFSLGYSNTSCYTESKLIYPVSIKVFASCTTSRQKLLLHSTYKLQTVLRSNRADVSYATKPHKTYSYTEPFNKHIHEQCVFSSH